MPNFSDAELLLSLFLERIFLNGQHNISAERFDNMFGFSKFLSQVIWPENICRFSLEHQDIKPQRTVGLGRGNSGQFESSKLHSLVQFESGVERQFFESLDRTNMVTWYCEQPLRLSYFYDGCFRNYYPDVLLALSDGRRIILELKPVSEMALEENLYKWAALMEYCSRKGYGMSISSGSFSITQFQYRSCNENFVAAVLEELAEGPLYWHDYLILRDRNNANTLDLVGMILRYGLQHKSLRPWKLFSPLERAESA